MWDFFKLFFNQIIALIASFSLTAITEVPFKKTENDSYKKKLLKYQNLFYQDIIISFYRVISIINFPISNLDYIFCQLSCQLSRNGFRESYDFVGVGNMLK